MDYSELYSAVYLLLNIFGTYIIYRFMNVFFNNVKNHKIEITTYVLYYCAISYLHLYVNEAIVNMFCNIALFFAITWNYRSSLKKKILVSLLIYAILLVLESFIVIITLELHLENDDYVRIVGLVAIKIVSLILVLTLTNIKHVNHDIRIPFYRWISILFFPLGSLILFCIIVTERTRNNILIFLAILLAFNLLVFHIYEILNREYFAEIQYEKKKKEADLLNQKSIFYENQLEILNSFQEKMRAMKHNYDNDVLVLGSLINNKRVEEAKSYISKMGVDYEDYGIYSNTGNVAIDSLLNYKLSMAEKMGTELTVNIKIPDTLKIEKNDLSVILGCLLDNAAEALEKTRDKKLSIRMQYDRNILYVHLVNSFSGSLMVENDSYITSKEDKENHGIGLRSVQKAIDKYHGELIVNVKDGLFSVDLLIYDGV